MNLPPGEQFFATQSPSSATGDSPGGDGRDKKPRSPWLQNLREKLSNQPKKLATKAKEWAQAPGQFLKTMARIDPKTLFAALGPALAVGGIVGGAAYATANEREDNRQVETVDLAPFVEADEITALREQVAGLEFQVTSTTELLPTIPATQASTAPDLTPTLAVLADRIADLEGLDPAEAARLEELAAELDALATVTGTTVAPPPTVDLGPLSSSVADAIADIESQAAAAAARTAEIESQAQEIAALDAVAAAVTSAQDAAAERVDELEAIIENLPTGGGGGEPPFDPSALEAADTANADATAAALAEAQAALAAVEAAQADIDEAAIAIEDIETIFYAQLVEDYSQGVSINMTEHSCTSGANSLLLGAGPGVSTFRAVQALALGGEGCKEFRPTIPVLPAACSFPSAGSAQVRLLGSSSVVVTVSGSGTARLSSSQGTVGSNGASSFVDRFGVTASEVNEWDTFQFWPYSGTQIPYFQVYVQATVDSQQFIASAGWSDAIFKGTISCQT